MDAYISHGLIVVMCDILQAFRAMQEATPGTTFLSASSLTNI